MCSYCEKPKSVDHVASSCTLRLPQYTQRHNEVLKCVHKSLCIKYNFTMDKRVKRHRIENVIKNSYATIATDVKVETERDIRANRPDLVVTDYEKQMILIIDITVTRPENLVKAEFDKVAKYQAIAKEEEQRTGFKAKVIPFAISWDGNVTKENKMYRRLLGVSDKTHAYIQSVVLRQTLGIVSRDIMGLGPLMELLEDKANLVLEELADGYCDETEQLVAPTGP